MRILFCLLVVVGLVQCKHSDRNSSPENQKQPNILFILIDDQRNDALSCAGHPIIQTPTIDLLAKNGVRFTRAYVTTPICAASRASILTGLYEHTHQFTFGKPPLKRELSTNSYPYLLRQSGYNTGFVGKLGVKLEDQDSLLQDMFDFYKPSKINVPHFDTLADGRLRHSSEIIGDEAITFLGDQNNEKPFCLSLSFNAVHAVDNNLAPGNSGHYPYPKSVADLYENIEIPQPRLSDPQIYDNHPEFLKKSLNRERFFWRWDTNEKYQTNMRAYYRMISGYDNVVKKINKVLHEKGLDKNTVIIFSADNGYYMGDRGFAGKWSHYDESLRVPLIIYDPRFIKNKPNTLSNELVLNIDIPSTILDYAGIPQPKSYQGQSLLSLVSNITQSKWREDFIIEHRTNNPSIPKHVGVHGKRYVYTNYYEQHPPYEYLHDLDIDPDQLKNLVDDSGYREVLQSMRMKCDELIL